MKTIRVLIAEDSPTARQLLVELLGEDPEISVVGEASNGVEAVELTERLKPDLVIMDVYMPEMDGLAATKEIMIRAPTPIIVVSSRVRQEEIELSLSATKAGALLVLPKPAPHEPDFERARQEFLGMAKAMAGVKVVRRWGPRRNEAGEQPDGSESTGRVRVVGIAASTGGPAAVQRVLMDLPRDLPAPILLVQHIARGFVGGFAEWLGRESPLRVKLAQDGEPLSAGRVYIAPDDRHLGVSRSGRIRLSSAPPIHGFRPSATYLFESAAGAYGAEVAAVVLTGMGSDGLEGLRAVHAAGGRVLVQDEESSVVYGMGREAVLDGVADEVLPLERIAGAVVDLVLGRHGGSDTCR